MKILVYGAGELDGLFNKSRLKESKAGKGA